MQCQSYFSVYHSHYDLNVDANGGTSPMYNGNSTFRSGHYNEYVAPLPLPRVPPFAYKELLRQTMILQEDTFKDQVQELHRLYKRQKELMHEMKTKEMLMNHLHIEDQSSNSYDHIPFFKSHCTPSIGRENIQTSLSSVKDPKPLTGPFASRNGGISHDLDFAESKGKKIKGKLLDLELPAEVYIDSDEEEFLEATPPATLSPNKRAKVEIESDVKSSTADESSQINTNLADLNEPLTISCLEESGEEKITTLRLEISEVNHDLSSSENSTPDGDLPQSNKAKSEVGPVSSARKPAYNLVQNPSVVQALPSINSQMLSTRGAKISGRKKILGKADVSSPNSRVTRSSKSSCCGSNAKNLDLNHIDLNSIANSNPESTPSSREILNEGETMEKSKRFRMIDINIPCDLTPDDEPMSETQLEMDLEAPISPEVEEYPPPRGSSEEGLEALVELAKIAAEAIVSLSSSQCKFKIFQKCEASSSHNLEWFAGIVSSFSIDTCIIDDYEAMTLELTEMTADDYWCKNTTTVQISSDNCSLPCQTRKGRTRRSKRKDFQREVLPSLASLSRYEVTEDIQLIEGLMDAAGTPWQLSRTRRACRMGRKPRVSKHQTSIDEAPELLTVLSWGKVNKRSRIRRIPTSPSLILKWLEFVI